MPWQPLDGETTELTAIHAALLATHAQGEILCFGDWAGSGSGGVVHATLSRVFRVADGSVSDFADEDLPDTNGFCGGQAWLADGRMLLAGGTKGWPEVSDAHEHDPHYDGERACWLYLPQERRWTRVRDLSFQPGSDSIGGGRWYPTLVTLGNGEVFAVAGHPDVSDTYNGRHNNNTAERYSPPADRWTLLADSHTAPDTRDTDSYPRWHLLPDGRLFCGTSGDEGDQQIMDPSSGAWTGPSVDASALPGYYSVGSAATSVLLPLLPPLYAPRIVAFNSPTASAFRIDPAINEPAWTATANRVGDMAGRDRENGCATLLPTGHVALTGGWPRGSGDDPMDDDLANATLGAELYDPGIAWATGAFSEGDDWLDDGPQTAQVGRGYHSTALLLPDGRVWTAGSTGALVGGETRVEYYAPFYVGQSRPTLSDVPAAVTYGATFTAQTNRDIERVALIRSGTVTHGFNSDQRYIGLEFEQDGDELSITTPPNANIAPPGPYMLWVIDADDRPCELAAFLRVSSQQLQLYTDRSTFSVHEVAVLGTPANFPYAFFLVLDGALPGEVGNPVTSPEIVFTYPGGETVPGMTWSLAASKWENPAAPPDTAQRLTFAGHIEFTSDAAFDAITGQSDDIQMRATLGGFTAVAPLVLTKNPNPWMRDGETHWLSTDVRVFQIQPGFSVAGVVHGSGATAPFTFIKALCEKFEELEPEVETHPFLVELETDQLKSALTFAGEGGNGDPVYNYAVAKVRMTAPGEVDAEDVGVFFRLFRTASTGFEYHPESYAREGSGAGAYPVLGRIGGDIVTIPFFSEARAGEGEVQPDILNRKTIAGSGAESRRYYGCWLDINQPTPEFEEDGDPKSVQEILVGEHQCLVAEVDYPLETIPQGATPGSNENLSQRNLIINEAPNPAGPATRVIAHSLEIAPSKTPATLPPVTNSGNSTAGATRLTPDELVFSWGNIPAGSQVTLFLPDVDVDQVMAMVARRSGPAMIARVDAHTLRLTVGGITYVPIPGGRQATIPTLLTIQLPADLVKGTVYRATIKQFDGRRRRIIASVQLTIPITTSEEILPEEKRKLAVYRHIVSKMAAGNKWRPVLDRLVGVIEDRVRGLGGDPDSIRPSWTGNPPKEDDMDERDGFSGKVANILYDCFGDFSGFVVESCRDRRRFEACEPGIEKVVRAACHDRDTITVLTDSDGRTIKGIIVHCCAGAAKSLLREKERPRLIEPVRERPTQPPTHTPQPPVRPEEPAHDHGHDHAP